jgi:membrane-associated protease RseP (regulator of RpoE activity)
VLSILGFVLVLIPLVVVHELGHFLFAKLFKVRADAFSVGFGPVIFKKQWGETEFRLSAIPLGGYVKLLGEDPSVELSEEDRVTVDRARKIQKFLAQPMFVAEVFTGLPGIFTPVDDTVESFEMLCNGDLDHLPEQAFFNVGGAEDAMRKAAELEKNA